MLEDSLRYGVPDDGLNENEVVGGESLETIASVLVEEDHTALLGKVSVVVAHRFGRLSGQTADVLDADDRLGEMSQANGEKAHARADVEDSRLTADVGFWVVCAHRIRNWPIFK